MTRFVVTDRAGMKSMAEICFSQRIRIRDAGEQLMVRQLGDHYYARIASVMDHRARTRVYIELEHLMEMVP